VSFVNNPQPGPTLIYGDNAGAISLIEDPRAHKRTKHIEIKYHRCDQVGATLKELLSKKVGAFLRNSPRQNVIREIARSPGWCILPGRRSLLALERQGLRINIANIAELLLRVAVAFPRPRNLGIS
jgi:hypothetical protein